MYYRFRLFVFIFADNFEKSLKREVAKVDFSQYTRRPGVLVARGLIAPTMVAFYNAARLALRVEPWLSPKSARRPA